MAKSGGRAARLRTVESSGDTPAQETTTLRDLLARAEAGDETRPPAGLRGAPVSAALQRFPPVRDYSSLSVKDLLDARDAYHLHLSHLESVVATAIGRYRIRKGDWYATHPPSEPRPATEPRLTGERTVYNSVVTAWSWPCVLVFVDRWLQTHEFAESPDQMVPRALFLPDGRVIPTCVVKATSRPTPALPNQLFNLGKGFLGGGTLIFSEVQNRLHLGSIACLVTDGTYVYGLTNRHVTGEGGREIFTIVGGERFRVGVSDSKQIGKKAFCEVYRGWQGTGVQANVDAGLIRLDDLSYWTTQIYRLGAVDPPLDLNTDTITLDLIDCPVRAFGGSSGELAGKIYGLFYRYKSLGGVDYVADLLIGGYDVDHRTETLPGDSGTLWCLEQRPVPMDGGEVVLQEQSLSRDVAMDGAGGPPAMAPRLRPVALQWGGHVILDPQGGTGAGKGLAHSYALATCLSTVLREVDLDVVRDWNTGLPEYWGAVGHYAIAAKACLLGSAEKLRTLMLNNLQIVSYPDAEIRPQNLTGLTKKSFVPLADVPDMVWKADARRRSRERPGHFADMDTKLPSGANKGRTLLDLCRAKAAMRTDVAAWIKHYEAIGVRRDHRGLLPFRVWQLYHAMVDALTQKDVPLFLCAAGTMAHYVGDACQPLHISYMHDGDPADLVEVVEKGRKKMVPRAHGVHAAYESKMLNQRAPEIISRLNDALRDVRVEAEVAGGRQAGKGTVELMMATFTTLKPKTIIDAFLEGEDGLWEALGTKTVATLLEGTKFLAVLWESAWKEGGGDALPESALGEADRAALVALYTDPKVLPSRFLHEIAVDLK